MAGQRLRFKNYPKSEWLTRPTIESNSTLIQSIQFSIYIYILNKNIICSNNKK